MDTRRLYQCPIFSDWHDPIRIRRELHLKSDGQFDVWLSAQGGEDATDSMRAHEHLIPVVREVFGLPTIHRVTGDGVTDDEALRVVAAFLEWLEGKE